MSLRRKSTYSCIINTGRQLWPGHNRVSLPTQRQHGQRRNQRQTTKDVVLVINNKNALFQASSLLQQHRWATCGPPDVVGLHLLHCRTYWFISLLLIKRKFIIHGLVHIEQKYSTIPFGYWQMQSWICWDLSLPSAFFFSFPGKLALFRHKL